MSLFELCDDILELIEIELRPRLKYNQVVREYKDPRFHKAAPLGNDWEGFTSELGEGSIRNRRNRRNGETYGLVYPAQSVRLSHTYNIL